MAIMQAGKTVGISATGLRGCAPVVELQRVTLARLVDCEEGRVPAGATGTIVHVWRNGAAFEVEFTQPFHAVATVQAQDIAG